MFGLMWLRTVPSGGGKKLSFILWIALQMMATQQLFSRSVTASNQPIC